MIFPRDESPCELEAFDLNEVSISTITREVTVDGDAPIVRFLEPGDGSVLVGNNLFDVGLRVTNETEQVVMTLTTEAGEQLGELTQNGGQAFNFSIDPAAVGPGTHVLIATVTDLAGNSGSTSRTITLRFCLEDRNGRHHRKSILALSNRPL